MIHKMILRYEYGLDRSLLTINSILQLAWDIFIGLQVSTKPKQDESYFPRSWYRGADFWGDVGCPTYMAQNKEQKEEEKTSFDLRY